MTKITFLLITLFLISFAPAQVPTQWFPHGIGGGGALYAPSFSPHNGGEAYLGCDMSGLYHTVDYGASWSILPFYEIRGGNFTCVQFTNDPLVLYSLSNNSNGYTPYKSVDGGASWASLTADPTGDDAWALYADPQNFLRLIVTDYSDLWFSANGGTSFGAAKYHSNSGGGCYIAGVFFDSSLIYVGTNMGLLVSTDGGSTFNMLPLTGITAGQGLLSFTGAKQGSLTRFVALTADTIDLYNGITGGDYWGLCLGVYTLDGGAGTWVLKTNGLNLANDFVFFAGMARNDINTAYLAGGGSSGDPIVFKTTNAGNNWTGIFLTANNQNIYTGYCGYQGDYTWGWAGNALGFAVAPNDANKAMITDYGFCHLTTDGGIYWRQAYVPPAEQNPSGSPTPKAHYYHTNGLEQTSVWWLTWSDSAHISGSYTDIRGTRSTDGGSTWSFDYTGHSQNTMYQALKHPNGTLYAATSTIHDLYQSTYLQDSRIDNGGGRILYSINQGAAWQILHDFGHPVIFLALDSRHPNRMYASVVHHSLGGIFVSNDIQNGSGSTWTKLTNPPRTQGHPFNIYVLWDSTLVCTYSGRRDSSGAFTASSGVFVSTDNGTSWLDRSDNGMRYWTKDLNIDDPTDSGQTTWYAGVFSGWGGPPNNLGGLYRTTNRGVSWTRINDLLWVESCCINWYHLNEMFMASGDNGLWFSDNIQSANPTFTLVASYPFSHPLRIFYNPYNGNEIWVTSFGNGLKAGYISTEVSEFPQSGRPSALDISVFPNPISSNVTITLNMEGIEPPFGDQERPFKTSRHSAKSIELQIFDISGRVVRSFTLGSMPHALIWDLTDQSGRFVPSGVYFIHLKSNATTVMKKLVVVR